LKKLITALILLLLALASTTYLYYTHWYSSHQAAATLPYVPQSAALIYEVDQVGQQWEAGQAAAGQDLRALLSTTPWQQHWAWLAALVGDPQRVAAVPLTVSVHGLDEEQLGCLFYLNTYEENTQAFLGTIMTQIQEDTAYTKSVRSYLGYRITEIAKSGTQQRLAYLKHKQYIIASYSPWLVEEVVQGLVGKRSQSFLRLKRSENKQGSLYINFAQLPQLLRTMFRKEGLQPLRTALSGFAQASQLNLTTTAQHLLLNGWTAVQPQHWVHTLAGQTTGSITLAPYLPQSTVLLQHLAFSDPEQLLAALQQYRAQPQAEHTVAQVDVHALSAPLHPLLQGEIAHCTLAAEGQSPAGQLVLMRVSSTQDFIEALQGLNVLAPYAGSGTDRLAPTYALQTPCFQQGLPGQLFPAFEAHFLTSAEDCIVLANSQEALQTWQKQYRQGKTWAHALTHQAWLERTLDQVHYSVMVELPQLWPSVVQWAKPHWKPTLEACKALLQQCPYASLQLVHEPDAGCYMSALLACAPPLPPTPQAAPAAVATAQEAAPRHLAATPVFQTEAPLILRPWLVKSHQGAGHYWLLQDASYCVYFLNAQGQLLWKKALEGPITTNIFEIDFYANHKVQYLFATDSHLHLLDYYGRKVSKYPHPLPQRDAPVWLNVVDYNRDKNYRFLLATAQGQIYLKDKHYRSLPHWDPLALQHAFAATPFHSRVLGKDYFLAIQTTGTVQAWTRKGESYPGFPVALPAPVSQPLWVHKGKTAADTHFVVLTDAGQRIHLGLDGQIQATLLLPRPDAESRFVLCPDNVAGRRYVVMRQDKECITLFNEAGSLLFDLPYKGPQYLLQYYDFGDTHQCYVVTDLEQQCTYLYDHAGQPLHEAPLRNRYPARLVWAAQQKQLTVYTSFDNVLARKVLQY